MWTPRDWKIWGCETCISLRYSHLCKYCITGRLSWAWLFTNICFVYFNIDIPAAYLRQKSVYCSLVYKNLTWHFPRHEWVRLRKLKVPFWPFFMIYFMSDPPPSTSPMPIPLFRSRSSSFFGDHSQTRLTCKGGRGRVCMQIPRGNNQYRQYR